MFISKSVEMYIHNEAKEGNDESGDTYFTHVAEDYILLAIADGLGSGPEAKRAATIIPDVLREYHHETFVDLFTRFTSLMCKERGAAVALVKINLALNIIEHSSIGNVRFYLLREKGKVIYPPPTGGYVSGKQIRVKTKEFRCGVGDLFFFHSDGVIIRSPRGLLEMSDGALDLYMNAMQYIDQNDDSTFIAGSLL